MGSKQRKSCAITSILLILGQTHFYPGFLNDAFRRVGNKSQKAHTLLKSKWRKLEGLLKTCNLLNSNFTEIQAKSLQEREWP